MALIALTSVKGSPGVTTTAVALGAVWPGGPVPLVAEFDPAGGDLAVRFDLPPERGLVALAAETRHRRDGGLVWRHTTALPGGLAVLPAPAGAEQTQAALRMIIGHAGLLNGLAADPQTMVLADCGRFDVSSPAQAVLRHAQVVLVCVEPRLDRLASLGARLPALRQANGHLGVVLVGSGGYGSDEVAEALNVRVAGVLPQDGRAATLAGGGGRQWAVRRLPLLRAAHTLARRLAAAPALAPQPAQSQQPPQARPSSPPAREAARSARDGEPASARGWPP